MLLEAIDTHGSINGAAQAIDVSYRRAWSYIDSMEKRLGITLVIRRAGGKNGGGASLTDEAREFIHKYSLLEEGIRESVDIRFNEVFDEQPIGNL
jgi:molybdate transport system regulatory protein